VFERFSDAARRTVVLAQEQSRLLRHDAIRTEHLLLGVLAGDDDTAGMLEELGVWLEQAQMRVIERVGRGRKDARGHVPFSPRAQRSLELAAERSSGVGDGQVEPQDLLRGVLAQPDSVGVAILESFGVDLALLDQRLGGTGAPTDRSARAQVRIERGVPDPEVVDALLRGLPDWFGIDEAIDEYVARSARLPAYTAVVDGTSVGVLALEHHSDRVAEHYVLAVARRWHRHGVGRALLEAAEHDLAQAGVTYVQVKTLGASHPSPEYAATRRFYEAMGYQGLEEYPADSLWPGNPCLVMVKHLACSA
jgi:GNAT superfamily N-acetyltransferase